MNSHEKRSFQAFRRAQAWLVARRDLAAAVSTVVRGSTGPQPVHATDSSTATKQSIAAAFISSAAVAQKSAALDDVVAQLTTLAAEQDQNHREARGAAKEIVRLRTELVSHQMRHVAIIAKAAIPDLVRMSAALQRPTRMDNEALIGAATAMADVAGQYKDLLVAEGLPADFADQLRTGSVALRQAIDSLGAAVGLRLKAGQAAHEAVRRGVRILDALSVIVAREYRGDAATLAQWNQQKRVTLVGPRQLAAQPPVMPAVPVIPPVPPVTRPVPSVVQAPTHLVETRPPASSSGPQHVEAAAA